MSLQNAIRLAARLNYDEGIVVASGNLALVALEQAEWAKANALARDALKAAEQLGRLEVIAECCTTLARALAAQGRGAEGSPYAERAVDLRNALRSPKLPEAQAALAACAAPPVRPPPD